MRNARRLEDYALFDEQAAKDFTFLVTPAWRERIAKSRDPEALVRQVLPVADELESPDGFSRDPVAESRSEHPALIRKYTGRLLVMATWACSAHCRFCFRRHVLNEPVGHAAVQNAFHAYMAQANDVSEVILSGGDPLTLGDGRLAGWLESITRYPQVRRIRIHTREPVFSPGRITPALCEILEACPLPVAVVLHVNHADELGDKARAAITRLRKSGATLLMQSVLLRGVNDSVNTLADLFERAADCGLVPYYLHQLDRVTGAAHFEVDRARGLEIVRELRHRLPGYLVPRYVEEVPGEASKRPVEDPC